MGKKPITTDGKLFKDLQGRHILLHGINMVCKEIETNHIGNYTDEDFFNLKKWGFNVIRLGIFWDSVEPLPGIYDDQYLLQIDKLITLAAKNDIYVFLDMHQDLFSCKYADGAPEWATLIDGMEHIATDLWSESYLISPAVQTAFDNFWHNKAAEDGIGIQDHYINMWRHIATRHKDNDTVIGYDIMNEPFIGSSINSLLPVLLTTIGEAVYKDEPIDYDELQMLWLDSSQKMNFMSLLSDKNLYTKLVRTAEGITQQFEELYLNDFYNKVGRAIRQSDKHSILFLETNYFSNMGMKTGIKAITDINGKKDSNLAFSPHGYDLLVDTKDYNQVSNVRIDIIFETHNKVQDDLNLPMLIGEWGCYPDATTEQLPQAAYLVKIFESYLASDTYFDFSHIYNNLITQVIVRAYPMKVAGEILKYSYDYSIKSFYCTFIEKNNVSGDNIIYIPDLQAVKNIVLEPFGSGYSIESIPACNAGYIIIPAIGEEIARTISF